MNAIEKLETQLLQQLQSNAVTYEIFEHDAVYTVSESEKINANIASAHTKNLFLRDKFDAYYLVTLLADKRVDLGQLSNILGAGRFSFGSADKMQEYLRVSPGSVTPLAVMNDTEYKVQLVLDEILTASPYVNVHPLRNTATLRLSGLDIVRMSAKWKHAPTILTVPAKSENPAKNED